MNKTIPDTCKSLAKLRYFSIGLTMKVIISIFFICSCNELYSQSSIKYHYVLNERLNAKKSNSPLFGMDQEFITVRKYYSQFKFSETRLFTGDSKKSIVYKIEDGIWYYKHNNKWKLFYNPEEMIGGIISLYGVKHNIKFNGLVNIRNTTLHKISLHPASVSQSHSLEYYLNCYKGVTIIKSSNGKILLRTDNFKSPLTEDEIELL